jgi:diguanylate cyclase (GGDEF)-like protein
MSENGIDKSEGADNRRSAAFRTLVDLIISRTPADPMPSGVEQNGDYQCLRSALLEIRGAVMATASGDLGYPIRLKGYLPGALKALQASLRHLSWQTQAIAAGDFSQKVEFMGDFSISFNSMVAQLEESVRKLRNSEHALWLAAHRDQLTGMKNRTWFFELFEETLRARGQGSGDVAAIMFDVDHFKLVNDTYGHAAGDEALRTVARVVESLGLRDSGYSGRLGGEEFAIVMPATEKSAAFDMAERMRRGIEDSAIVHAGREFSITVSLGVALSHAGESAESLLGRADAAMYLAKESGRNRICG